MQLHVQYVAIFVYNWALLITVQFRGIEINYYWLEYTLTLATQT